MQFTETGDFVLPNFLSDLEQILNCMLLSVTLIDG